MGIGTSVSRTKEGCVACETFPHHLGTHYTLRDLTTLLVAQRRGNLLGNAQWKPLPGTFTASGKQLLISTHIPQDPDARCAYGVWLLEDTGYHMRVPNHA